MLFCFNLCAATRNPPVERLLWPVRQDLQARPAQATPLDFLLRLSFVLPSPVVLGRDLHHLPPKGRRRPSHRCPRRVSLALGSWASAASVVRDGKVLRELAAERPVRSRSGVHGPARVGGRARRVPARGPDDAQRWHPQACRAAVGAVLFDRCWGRWVECRRRFERSQVGQGQVGC